MGSPSELPVEKQMGLTTKGKHLDERGSSRRSRGADRAV